MELKKEDLMAISPDARTPGETLEKTSSAYAAKIGYPIWKSFLSAFLAGLFIAFGGLYYCLAIGDTEAPFMAQRVVGGTVFSVGLVFVLVAGADLFTGNTLGATSVANKKAKLPSFIRNLIVVWIGNLAGSLFAVLLVFFSGVAGMNGGGVEHAMIHVAETKMDIAWTTIFVKGILCNLFVCLAVWIGMTSKTVVDKVIGIILPISAFVSCGFEHCVANMFFLPLGVALNTVSAHPVEVVNMTGIFFNLSAATLGNIVGGLIIGMTYWAIYHKKAA